jgi:hypothetical protein
MFIRANIKATFNYNHSWICLLERTLKQHLTAAIKECSVVMIICNEDNVNKTVAIRQLQRSIVAIGKNVECYFYVYSEVLVNAKVQFYTYTCSEVL